MDSVVLEFPPPTHPLSENEKRKMAHWAQWRRRLDPWREATQWAWKMAEDKAEIRRAAETVGIEVLVELPFTKNARRDPSNYVGTCCKVIVDALTTKIDKETRETIWQGVWPDDNPQYVSVREPRIVVGSHTVRVWLTPRENQDG